MKNFKFIPLLLIALSLIVTSCAIDDDPAIVGQNIITKTVSFTTDEVIVPASATPYDVEVVISQAFGTNALIEYTVNGADQGATVPYGSAMGGLPLDVSTAGVVYDVVMTDISVLQKPANVDAVIDQANKTIKVIVVPAIDPAALQIMMVWSNMDNTNNDLDLWITDEPPTTGYVSSASISPVETVSFSNGYPDGTYNALAREWFSVQPVTDVTMYVVHPNGTIESFTDSINQGSGFNYFLKFDKVGATYTVTQVPALPVF